MSHVANRWLSMHAGYACRHAGACCTSHWPIPLERVRVDAVRMAVADGRIAVREPWLTAAAGAPAEIGGVLAIDARGHCVFHQHDRCAMHRTLGHDRLPSACQHFPRVCSIDARGVAVTLSHYCPTAAWLLFDDAPVTIVEGPAPWPGHESPEGLDARDVWPPLLTEHVLMDHESYAAWERYMVDVLAGEASLDTTPEDALGQLRAGAASLVRWTPDDGPLLEVVRSLGRPEGRPLRERTLAQAEGCPREDDALALFDRVRGAVAPGMDWDAAPGAWADAWTAQAAPAWAGWAPVVRRFLAAHAFASWLAYQGRGVLTIVRGVEAAYAVLRIELARACVTRDATADRTTLHHAIRRADLLLRHHLDPQAFADAMSEPGLP